MAQWKQIRLGTVKLRVPSLASLSGLGIRPCCELWYRSWTQLGSDVAVAVVEAGSCSSNWTPSLGTSICHGWVPKKTKTKNKKKDSTIEIHINSGVLGDCSIFIIHKI